MSFFSFIVFYCISTVLADEHDHTYQDNDEVVLWMNTVGTYHNRDRRPMHTSLYHSVQVREIDEGIYYYNIQYFDSQEV